MKRTLQRCLIIKIESSKSPSYHETITANLAQYKIVLFVGFRVDFYLFCSYFVVGNFVDCNLSNNRVFMCCNVPRRKIEGGTAAD